jgi:hypothetical protein
VALPKNRKVPVTTGTARNPAEIKRRIQATPDLWKDLDPIVKAGADPRALLDLLARAVTPQEKTLALKARAKQRQLASIAGQVRTVTRHAERLANDPSAYIGLYSPFSSGAAEEYKKREAARLASRWPFAAMRSYAEWAEKEQRAFGLWLRRNSQKEGNLGILFLLSQVHLWTGRLFEPKLARLLTDASHAAGENETFTPRQLTRMFERYAGALR